MKDGKSKFNPKIGHAFENAAFGEGSILCNVDADGLKAIAQNVQVGSSILFKFNKVTSRGNKHYFAEILPPMQPRTNSTVPAKKAKPAPASELD